MKQESRSMKQESRSMKQKIHGSLFILLDFPTKRGFSLLEMVIAIGIFGVVILSATSIVISANEAQLKASHLRIVQDTIRFALEFMTKEMRTGKALTASVCSGGLCERIRFTNDRGCTIEYFRQNSILRRQISGACAADTLDMTSDDVSVDNLLFFVRGNIPGPGDGQTATTIAMKVSSVSGKAKVQTVMNLQTTVTQRFREMQ